MRRRASIVEHPRARRAASAPTAVTPRLGCSHRGPWLRRTARRGVRMMWDGGEDSAGLHSSAGQFGRGLRKCPCGMLPGVTRRVLNTKKNVRSHQSRRARTRKQKHVDRWGRSRGLTRENLDVLEYSDEVLPGISKTVLLTRGGARTRGTDAARRAATQTPHEQRAHETQRAVPTTRRTA